MRVFSSSRGQRRFRRATDVFLLVPAVLGLALLVALYPPSRFERALTRLLASVPGWLEPLWELLYDGLALLAVVLVVAALVGGRRIVLLHAVASVVLAGAVAVGAARLALGDCVVEFGLTVGLTAAGMPEEAALATAVLDRIATFYLPSTWGFFAMRWLQRGAHL